jgi:hypothetical protein
MLSAAFVPLRLLDRIVVTDKTPDRVFPFFCEIRKHSISLFHAIPDAKPLNTFTGIA